MVRNQAAPTDADPMVLFGALDLADKRGDYRSALRLQERLRRAGWDVRKVSGRGDRRHPDPASRRGEVPA
jgi:hypothetical protein